jgi:hypothetical protein
MAAAGALANSVALSSDEADVRGRRALCVGGIRGAK